MHVTVLETLLSSIPMPGWFILIFHQLLNGNVTGMLVWEISFHFIKPGIAMWKSSHNADYEVLLNRLRVGDTRFTHGPLLRGEPYPECDDCYVLLTLFHIFIECPFLEQYRTCLRRKYGNNFTVKSILGKPSI